MLRRPFSKGQRPKRKRLLATWVHKVILAPDRREVEITLRVPEPVMNRVVAGALYVAIHDALAPYLTRRITIPSRAEARNIDWKTEDCIDFERGVSSLAPLL